ncbi:hypothetical protein AMTRI_Chr02g218420 [Amborella trichopoda]
MFSIVSESPGLHTRISAITISRTSDFQRFLCKMTPKIPRILHPMDFKGLNVPQNLRFCNPRFFSATSFIMKGPMPVQYESAVECCRLADLSVYSCVKATTTSLFSY